MMEKALRIFRRDADGECHSGQLFARPAEQTDREKIYFFAPARAIEGDVTNRGEVEKIDISLNGLLQLGLRLAKDRLRQRFGRLIFPAVRSVSGNPASGIGNRLHSSHR